MTAADEIRHNMQQAAKLLADLLCNPDMPLSAYWALWPRDASLPVLEAHVYYPNSRERRKLSLAAMEKIAVILDTRMVLDEPYYQSRDEEQFVIRTILGATRMRIWTRIPVARKSGNAGKAVA